MSDSLQETIQSLSEDSLREQARLAEIDKQEYRAHLAKIGGSAEDLIWVRSNLQTGRDGSDPIALWERHPAHPGGEVFVCGPQQPVKVARTKKVEQAIYDKKLLIVPE